MSQIPFLAEQHKLAIKKPVRLIELFAGIGAQAKSLENLSVPFEHYRICEFDKFAVKSYNTIHGTNFEVSDIKKIHAEDLGVVNTDNYCYILTYSFPCQDLSIAGKQRGMQRNSGTRSGLLWEVERLLREMKELPQILLMENVPNVISKKNIADFTEWMEFLDKMGYKSKYEILNAKDYGVPQNRKRCFMVSWLGDYCYDFPKPIPLEYRLKDVLEPVVNEKYYISDEQVNSLINSSYHQIITRSNASCKCVGMLSGGKWDKCKEQNRRVYLPDGISPTITTCGGGNQEVKIAEPPIRVRKLTPRECWRLMDFTDADFDKASAVNSNSQLCKQAGNSIVVNCLTAILGQMFEGKEDYYKQISFDNEHGAGIVNGNDAEKKKEG